MSSEITAKAMEAPMLIAVARDMVNAGNGGRCARAFQTDMRLPYPPTGSPGFDNQLQGRGLPLGGQG
jgi:hypothetical protein